MAVAQLKIAETSGAAMDTPVAQPFWRKWSLPVRVGIVVGGIFAFVLVVVALIAGDGLQQNEIALEQNSMANARALSDIDYNITRLAKGVTSTEARDTVADELAHYRTLRPVQAETNQHQAELRARLLPAIHDQLAKLQQNLEVVRGKLDNLIVRSPVAGRITGEFAKPQ